jgi:hypothetical protein
MESARVIGVHRKSLLAADLRVEVPSIAQMTKAGLMQRCSRARAWIFGADL